MTKYKKDQSTPYNDIMQERLIVWLLEVANCVVSQ